MDIKKFKQQLLDKLYAPYQKCTMCPLGTLGRTHVVFGEGNPDARAIFVGEGPGREEDLQGKPFVGRSGKLLTRTLHHFGVERSEVFITNIVKCRPPNNRAPTILEATTCKNLLLDKQIKIIRPRLICTLGGSALQSLLGKDLKITKARGKLLPWNDIIVIPCYHPAYILRNPKELTTFVADIKLVIDNMKQKK